MLIIRFRFKKLPSPPKEIEVPARDQIKLKTAKPTRASEVNEGERVKIAEDKAKLKTVTQGPEVQKEEVVPHNQQVQLKVRRFRFGYCRKNILACKANSHSPTFRPNSLLKRMEAVLSRSR